MNYSLIASGMTIVLCIASVGAQAAMQEIQDTSAFRQEVTSALLETAHDPGDPLASAAASLAPDLVLALMHESEFRLDADALRRHGIDSMMGPDFVFFGHQQRVRLHPFQGFQAFDPLGSYMEIVTLDEYGDLYPSSHSVFLNHMPKPDGEEITRVAVLNLHARDMMSQEHYTGVALKETTSGSILLYPVTGTRLVEGQGMGLNPESVSRDVLAEAPGEIVANVDELEAVGNRSVRRSPPTSPNLNRSGSYFSTPNLVIGGGGALLVSIGLVWILRARRKKI